MSEVILKSALQRGDEGQKERGERTLQKSEKACLISNSSNTMVSRITQLTMPAMDQTVN